MSEAGPWLALGLLGAYHGLNPAMGWLFAVALGMQERRLAAVLLALIPIALGHELSVALTVVLVDGARILADPQVVRALGAVALLLFGVYKLVRPRSHPRWVGMRVSRRELVLWSFLMSTAHGAGLMLFPFLLGLPTPAHAEGIGHLALPAARLTGETIGQDVAAVMLHTLAMLATMAAIASLVYLRLGVTVLRQAWVNFDLLWAGALVLAGVVTLFT